MKIKQRILIPTLILSVLGFTTTAIISGNILHDSLLDKEEETSRYILGTTLSGLDDVFNGLETKESFKHRVYATNIDEAYPYILDDNDELYLHISDKLQNSKGNVVDTETHLSIFPGIKKATVTNSTYTYHFTHPTKAGSHPKRAYVAYYEPLQLYVIYATYTENLAKSLRISYIVLGIVTMFLLIIILGPIYLFTKKAMDGVTQVGLQIADVSEGDGDLTKRISYNKADEVGDLSTNFNTFLEDLLTIISSIKAGISSLNSVSQDLQNNTENSSTSLEQITDNVSSIQQTIISLDSTIGESVQEVESLIANINNVHSLTEDQATSVEESSAAIEEMMANITSIANITEKKKESTTQLIDFVDKGEKNLNVTTSYINDIFQSTDEIKGTLNVLNSVAQQTNLLAMNAAIEAAHAGDAGKGFAVVADEIRKLAEESQSSSERIGATLKGVISTIDKVQASGLVTSTSFEKIHTLARDTYKSFEEISVGVQESSTGASQITEAMGELQNISSNVATAVDNMRQSSNEVQEKMIQSSNKSISVKGAIEDISVGSKEIKTSIDVITTNTQVLIETNSVITKDTDKFKVGK